MVLEPSRTNILALSIHRDLGVGRLAGALTSTTTRDHTTPASEPSANPGHTPAVQRALEHARAKVAAAASNTTNTSAGTGSAVYLSGWPSEGAAASPTGGCQRYRGFVSSGEGGTAGGDEGTDEAEDEPLIRFLITQDGTQNRALTPRVRIGRYRPLRAPAATLSSVTACSRPSDTQVIHIAGAG